MKIRGIDHVQIAMPRGGEALARKFYEDLAALLGVLKGAGYEVKDDEPLKGFDRAFALDPFGNRIELLESRSK